MLTENPLTIHEATLILYDLNTTDIDFLIMAITRWEHAFKTRQDWTMEEAIKNTDCPKHLETALCDTINSHRFYLTHKRKCLCMACDGQRMRIMLDSLPPLHSDQEIGDQ